MGLTRGFQVNPNSCGNSFHYSEYISFCAITDQLEGHGTTHALIEENDTGDKKLLGFITLRASSLVKRYDDADYGDAALEIVELAVGEEHEREGLGTILVSFALDTAVKIHSQYAAIRYITLCADEHAVSFYERFGFGKLENYGTIPKNGWNVNCIPMYLRLPI